MPDSLLETLNQNPFENKIPPIPTQSQLNPKSRPISKQWPGQRLPRPKLSSALEQLVTNLVCMSLSSHLSCPSDRHICISNKFTFSHFFSFQIPHLCAFHFYLCVQRNQNRPMGQIVQSSRHAGFPEHFPQSRPYRARHGARVLASRSRHERADPGPDQLQGVGRPGYQDHGTAGNRDDGICGGEREVES